MIFPVLLGVAAGLLLGGSPNTVTVTGRRAEMEREERPGKSLILRPEDPTRFDTKALLSREASLALPETGRVTAQGFAVPRVRGQDTRLTEVYVEDMLLQDPYSGLPLIDELDVRAFGELAVYQGVAPVSLPTLNGIGVVQYRARSRVPSSVGVTAGRPYGISTWGVASGDGTRVYGRRHVTDGRYDYYSDNGTPYSTSDDDHETRENNHRSSTQFLLYDQSQIAPNVRSNLLLLSQESRTGLPNLNANLPTLAEQEAKSRLANWEVERDSISLRVSAHDDRRKTFDPGHATLSTADSTGIESAAMSLGAAVDLFESPRFGRLSYDHDESHVRLTADEASVVKVKRSTERAALGVMVPVLTISHVEAKVATLQLRDRFEDDQRITTTHGGSLAIDRQWTYLAVYAQAGRNRRAPSLLEEFGDGGAVLLARKVEPETGIHKELGITAGPPGGAFQIGTSVFQDDTRDRITLVPALAGTLRAENIGRTRVRGLEFTSDATFDSTRLYATYTLLRAEDVTDAANPHRLPFVAEKQATAGIDQRVSVVTVRESSRYQGRVYRDLANSIEVPAYTVHDLSADTQLPAGENTKVDVGLAILNVTNVQKLPVSSPGTAENDGATSYSDVTGYALPGRQWRLTASLTF